MKASLNAQFIAALDGRDFDTEAMLIDDRYRNFSPDRVEEYRHENIVAESLLNGQFSQARRQCAEYGLAYAEQLAAFEQEDDE